MALSWRLLFPFGTAFNINFISRAQSEFGLDSATPRNGLGRGDTVVGVGLPNLSL